MKCPNCGKEMKLRHRRSDGNPFWGCSGFPKCRGTARYIETQERLDVNWSEYQVAVFDFIKNETGNAVVEAVAGSGKTTTIVEGLNYTPKDKRVAFVAFNRRIANELGKRAPAHVHVSTLHSLGLKNIREHYGKIKIENRKFWLIWKDYIATVDHLTKDKLDDNAVVVRDLVGKIKATLLEPTHDNLNYICDHFGIHVNGSANLIFNAVKAVFEISVQMIDQMVDFDDMIYAPASGMVPCQEFDFLFVDEAQDLNAAQISFVLNSQANGGRIIAVGDRAQSIYGFRGADTQAIPNLISALNAKVLPLSICYRCPKSHIEMAQELVPTIEPFEGKEVGTIGNISFSQLMETVKPGDLVMCRINAPLVAPAFELIRQGIKAVVLGRDIGKGLETLIKKIAKKGGSNSLLDLLHDMSEYRDREVSKLVAAKKMGRAASLDDQIETIIALASGCDTVDELFTKIETVFDDREQGVVFSSVHKAKGTEADRTFILRNDLMPHPMATSGWQIEQELNCQYVAYTRAKEEMYFVSGGF